MEILGILLVVLFVLLAGVTVVGHGIWVVLSKLFGSDEPAPPPVPRAANSNRRGCPRCLTPFSLSDRQCRVCGWPLEEGIATDERAALEAVHEQLERFARLGVVDLETRQKLATTLVEQKERVKARRQATAADAAVIPSIELVPISDAQPPAVQTPSPPPADRVRKYAASRAAAVADTETETGTDIGAEERPARASKQREAMSRLLASFMEEKHIRWGELVGGLLIVGCSIALVISFWSEIAARPLLKFVLFNGVTAALFGVGLYTERRWKIHTTSHAVLAIAALLVPLNFLAIAAFTQDSPPTDVLALGGEAVSLIVFSFLVFLAGRVLVSDAAVLLAAGVMIPSLMQLLVRRFAGPGMPLTAMYALAAVPIAAYLANTLIVARRRWQSSRHTPCAVASTVTDQPDDTATATRFGHDADGTRSVPATETLAVQVLVFLGEVTAATVVPVALLAYLVPPVQETLHWLSPLVLVAGLPALVVGLLFWQRAANALGGWGRADHRCASVPSSPQSVQLGARPRHDPSHPSIGLQTTGIAAGVLGALVMVAAVVLAWPDPATLLPTALAAAVVFWAVAWGFGIPAAHLPAGVALAAAWLVAFHLLRGSVEWTLPHYAPMRGALLSAISGHALVPLVAIFVGVAVSLERAGRRDDARMCFLLAAMTAAASLALVVWFGFGRPGDPHNATWTLAIYAVAAITAATRLDRPAVAWTATALLLAALVQAIVYRYAAPWALERPGIVAVLVHATLTSVAGLFEAGLKRSGVTDPGYKGFASGSNLSQAFRWSALATSVGAAALIAMIASATPYNTIAVYVAWLSVAWIVLALLHNSDELFTVSQAAAVLAIFAAIAGVVEPRAWYQASARPWLDPWFLEAQGVALAAYALLFGAVRKAVTWSTSARVQEGEPDWSSPSWLVRAQRLLNPPWPAVDRVVEVALVALVAVIAIYAVAPGIAQELSPLPVARGNVAAVREVAPLEQFELAGIPHAHAGDRGAWVLLAAVAMLVITSLSQRVSTRRMLAVLLLAAAVCPLLAVRWEPQVAVASALRWFSAAFFLLASVPIWWRGRSADASASADGDWRAELALQARDLLVALVVLVYVAMGAYVAQAALRLGGVGIAADGLLLYLSLWALIGAAAALIMWNLATNTKQGDTGFAERGGTRWATHARDVLLLLAFAPLAILLKFAIARVLDQHPIVGPNLDSWFRQIGWDVSYGVPLAAIAVGFVVYAIRDHSSRFAFAAGLLLNVVATIVALMRLARGGGTLDATAWITVAQVNAAVAGAVALVWLAAVTWHRRPQNVSLASPVAHPALLVTQVAFAAALCAAFLVPATARLAFEWSPLALLPAWVAAAGGVWGWCALGLTTASACWLAWRRRISEPPVAAVVAALIAMSAVTVLRFDWADFDAYHVLLVGCCAAAWLLPLVMHSINRIVAASTADAPAVRWSTLPTCLFAAAAVWLALWEYSSTVSVWPVVVLAAMSAWSVWVAWHDVRGGFMWSASLLAVIAGSIAWIEWGYPLTGAARNGRPLEFLWINVIIVAAMAVVSAWIHRRRVLERESDRPPSRVVAFHRFAAWLIVATLLLTTGIGLIADWFGDAIEVSFALAWAAWLAAAVAAIACWWDPAVRWPVACLYCVGLLAVGMFLDGLDFRSPMFDWTLANSLAAYSLLTSALWSRRVERRTTLARWGVIADAPGWLGSSRPSLRVGALEPPEIAATGVEFGGHGWLVTANLVLGFCVLALVTSVELTMENFGQRMVAAYAIGAQALAIGFLARGTVRTSLQYAALVFGVLFAVAFGWAWVRPAIEAPWLHRAIVSAAALAVMVVVYGFGLVKFLRRENEWTRAAARLVPLLAVAAVGLLLLVLGMEVAIFQRQGWVPIAPPALVAVALALVGLAAAGLTAALLPGRDPLGLSERGRTVYVYAAEGLAALLFMHIRVTMPYLFSGWFQQFWPLIVMLIAFVGVGLGELFRRRRQRVLFEPFENTGALLPLLPALGFWLDVDSNVDYSLVLLSIGALYAALSVLRRSFVFGILAAISANGSLWYLLFRQEGLGLLEHPQLWLIPPALSALIASYINRGRMTEEQSTALRYLCAIVIYVSSTADIFIHGVADAPWLPGVLAGLSILGVFAGIVLRVRAFLYLGTSFLLVALMTVIWYAAVEQQRTWIFWIAGIVTGMLILLVLGLFEKRRDDVLRVVEELKQWQA